MTDLPPVLTKIGRDEISWPLALYAFMESAAVYLRLVHPLHHTAFYLTLLGYLAIMILS